MSMPIRPILTLRAFPDGYYHSLLVNVFLSRIHMALTVRAWLRIGQPRAQYL